MKELPKAYDPKLVEGKIYALWEKSGFFNPDRLQGKRKKPYSIMMAPPNITGSLHMGHALEYTISDILIRYKRMQQYKTLWLPGTDHAGIATQNVVEKELKKQGITRHDIGREKLIEKIWEWKEKYGNTIIDQLKKLGCSADWSRLRFTMDAQYQKAVQEAFLRYYKKRWIYRAKRLVNWCSRCQTSLSDLELEYKQEAGKLWYIKYPLIKIKSQKSRIKTTIQNSKYIVVATTRPETMLGDAAVAVNPKDKRYKHLVGQNVLLPFVHRTIPIIADKLVDPSFGTGAVKVTPAHDLADKEIGSRHKLPSVQVIDEKGKMTAEAPLPYQGLSVAETRQKIVEDLQKLGLLEKTEDYTHQIPKCYRCDTTVEILPSLQWFLKMTELANMARQAVKSGKVKFHPKRWEKIYFAWLNNAQDWCISRQIWWGHRIPVWQCESGIQKSKACGEYFLSLKTPKKCPLCRGCTPKQMDDVLDTWFSSALWPFAVLGWPQKTRDLKEFYPASLNTNDRGIINLWDTRMIFSGMEFMKDVPFRINLIHPTVLTKEGKRMSKSLGTGIDPLELIQKYGADATRFGIAWQISDLQDIRFSEEHLMMGKKFCNKIYNAARFTLLQMQKSKVKIQNDKSKFKKNLTAADKRILAALKRTIESINRDLENYRFGRAAQKLYQFFWHEFCDVYIEASKSQLGNQKLRSQTQEILLSVLLTSLKLLHPFIPFLTEEIYQNVPLKNKKRCLMAEEWPHDERGKVLVSSN